MDVSENSGTPKSSILIGFSIINHPFWGTPIFGNSHIPFCSNKVLEQFYLQQPIAVFTGILGSRGKVCHVAFFGIPEKNHMSLLQRRPFRISGEGEVGKEQFKNRKQKQTANKYRLGGGNSNICYFHPDPWGNDPI